MLQLPEKKLEVGVDCTSLNIVPILMDRETYRHNSNYLKLCKSSGPLVIPALPEATLLRGPLGAFRGLLACARLQFLAGLGRLGVY